MSQNVKYMLRTDAVIQHKMADPRWTMREKVFQYKELVKLHGRDSKIISSDVKQQRRKQFKKLIALRDEIKEKRITLKSSLASDPQGIRNLLAEHDRKLLLAYQNLPPEEILENIKQITHQKKKDYDKLQFKKKEKAQILISLKLEIGGCENRAKCDYRSSCTDRLQFLEGHLQDVLLKKEVATTIQRNFRNILDVMKKDAVFFDSILISLKEDSVKQAICLYRITKLGQLATEYLDDRIQDYNLLERAVKKSMIERQRTIKSLKHQIKETRMKLIYLMEKESTTELTKTIPSTASVQDLQGNVESLNSLLEYIRGITYVSQFDEILSRMKDQIVQYQRLKKLADEQTAERDIMLKKRNHAELICSSLKTTMAGTTMQYIEMKKQYQTSVAGLDKIVGKNKRKTVELAEILLSIRLALQRLDELTSCVITSTDTKHALTHITKPETDVNKLISILTERYRILMSCYELLPSKAKDDAVKLYQHVLTEAYNKVHADKFASHTDVSLIIERKIEDPNIPTRDFIKKRSHFIVSSCAVRAEDEPITLLPLRGKTF